MHPLKDFLAYSVLMPESLIERSLFLISFWVAANQIALKVLANIIVLNKYHSLTRCLYKYSRFRDGEMANTTCYTAVDH